jgi:4-hydroxy-tetrahydrodipicolinate synthase
MRPLPSGAYCDLIMPFTDGTVDTDALSLLIKWQISNGISGIVVCGQMGEATSLTWAERRAVISAAVVAASGQVPVIAGTGTNATETTLAHTIAARELGADAAVIVTPYYNKPSQEGIFRHFEQISAVVDIPLVICNVPGRTASDLSPGTMARLASLPGIAGIQDCTGDLGRLARMPAKERSGLRCYSGHDQTAMAFNLTGGAGTFSAAANIAPRLVCAMHDALTSGNIAAAAALNARLQPIIEILEREPAPAVAKQALQFIHGISAETRLPLTPVEPETAAALRLLVDSLPRNAAIPAAI